MAVQALEGGFADAVLQSQQVFRALMQALANPGQPQKLGPVLTPPEPLGPELAALALTLCDHDIAVWLDAELATEEVLGWLRFHTGATVTQRPEEAQFALCRNAALPLHSFGQGTQSSPDRSTTIVQQVAALSGGAPLELRGPGIDGAVEMAVTGLPAGFLVQWAENRAQFPRGVDLLLVASGTVIGLPRTTRITEKGA